MKKILLFLFLAGICFGTVSITTQKAGPYACDGSQTDFTFSFPYNSTSEIKVILRNVSTGAETTQTLISNYTVSPSSSVTGGTVTFVTAPSSSYTTTIYRDTALTQEADIDSGSYVSRTTLENANDKLTRISQDLQAQINRCLKIPISDDDITTELDDSVSRAEGYLYFGDDGNPSIVTGVTPDDVVVSSFMETVLDSADSTSAMAALGGFQVFNVLDYNAVGDGVVNDTNAVADAISAAAADGGIVFFPAGTYLANINFNNASVQLVGVGNASIIQAYTTDPVITIESKSPTGQISGSSIQNLQLDGNGTSKGMYFVAVSPYVIYQCKFSNLYIYDTTYAVDMETPATDPIVTECTFEDIYINETTNNAFATGQYTSYCVFRRLFVYEADEWAIRDNGTGGTWLNLVANGKIRIQGQNNAFVSLTIEGIGGTGTVATGTTSSYPCLVLAGYNNNLEHITIGSTTSGDGDAAYGIYAAAGGPYYLRGIRYYGTVTNLTYPFIAYNGSSGYAYFNNYPSGMDKLESSAIYNQTLSTYTTYKNWKFEGALTNFTDGMGELPLPRTSLPTHSATSTLDAMRGRIVFNDTGDDHFYGAVQKDKLRYWKRLDLDPADIISYENTSVFYENQLVTY